MEMFTDCFTIRATLYISWSVMLYCSLLIPHNTVMIIFVTWWMFTVMFALNASISSFDSLQHTACAQERFCCLSIDFDIADLTEGHPL